ncbi:MAG: hypothetical protein HY820_43135 [Acidobacteria bacterium]|nr:hypothetical protein [Acidobacteriota bacterium]
MILNQIRKALSSIRKSGARTLVMGGQASIFYGAAQFSRDLDLLILTDEENLRRFQSALDELQAIPIAVPQLHADRLRHGHAIQFRCQREDVANLRIDIMSSLRGVDPFEALWERRSVIGFGGDPLDVIGIADLVKAKKTQRDKDWPVIRRLVDGHYFAHQSDPQPAFLDFWLRELRSPEFLIRVVMDYPEQAAAVA